jgi:Glycosyl hydrolases family 18
MISKKRLKQRLNAASCIEPLECRTLLSAGPQVIGYLPDYEFSHFSSINLTDLTQINYFSVVANSSGDLASTSASGYSFSQLQTVVTAAHSAPSRIDVSITIDPGSSFQTIANSSTLTNTFVSQVMAFIAKYNLDGVDLDYEPGALTTAQINAWGNLLAALHTQTAAKGLILSEAVQASQLIIPKADFSDVDRYLMMDYDLDYNGSAPYSDSIAYLTDWTNYGVPKADLFMGIPFFGSSGTSWSNSQNETYAQIVTAYETEYGSAPAPNLDTLTVNGTTWGFNGVTTVENKSNYVLDNGYGGVMVWELGQDTFTGSSYNSTSLMPAINSVFAAASETWNGSVSNSWNTPANWSFGAVPVAATNVVINSGSVVATSPLSVTSLTINGGTLALPEGVSTTQSLSLSTNASLNVGYGTLVINYGTGSDPIAAIRADIIEGYAGGSWTGAGIMSNGAQANSASYGLGYADSADAGNPANLSAGTIEIRYTLLGDANLNGVVDGTDFGILAANFNKGVNGWDQGDFNYDGVVDGTDFADLSANFNQGVSLPAVDPSLTIVPTATVTDTDNSPTVSPVLSTDSSSGNHNVSYIPVKHKPRR